VNNVENIIEIINISCSNLDSEKLWGFAVDSPKVQDQFDNYMLNVRGWVLGKSSPVRAVWLTYQNSPDKPLKIENIFISRPDVQQHYQNVENAENSGFSILASVIGMPSTVNLGIQAILEDGSHINMIRIQLFHKKIQSHYQPKLQPLILNTLGRSGSTWLMNLLAECPNVIVQKQYPYESYAAKYWLYMLFRFMSDPTKYLNIEVPDEFFSLSMEWLNGQLNHNNPIRKWFGRTYVEQVLAFCQQSVDGFYEQIAKNQGQKNLILNNSDKSIIYFAEKYGPGYPVQFLYEIYPNVKEIFLVRDFRDVLCSSLSFSQRIGQFGGYSVQDKENAVKITQRHAQGLFRAWQNRSAQAHLVRYEDLISNPTEVLENILDYLKVEYNHSTAEHILKRATKSIPSKTKKQHQTTDSPQKSIGRWQSDLDDSLKGLCEKHLTEELQAFGYDTDK